MQQDNLKALLEFAKRVDVVSCFVRVKPEKKCLPRMQIKHSQNCEVIIVWLHFCELIRGWGSLGLNFNFRKFEKKMKRNAAVVERVFTSLKIISWYNGCGRNKNSQTTKKKQKGHEQK